MNVLDFFIVQHGNNFSLQRCSKFKNTGHISLMRTDENCPVNLDLSDMKEDAVEEEMDLSDGPEEFEGNVHQAEKDLADIDELLDSDDDLLF